MPASPPPAIELRSIDKSFGAVAANRAVSLAIAPGSFTGIVGENGAGKSILMALYRGARILILDEPTGVLTPQEADQLFGLLKALQARGVSIILVSHKLREIMAVTDSVHVMRQGRMVAQLQTAATDRETLAELMVGRKVRLVLDKAAARPGAPRVVVEGATVRDRHGVARLDRVDLTVRSGEIVGIAGVTGNGQGELLELLAGIRAPTAGRIVIDRRVVTATDPADPGEMRALGIAHVPEDRLRYGLVGPFEA